MRKVLGLIACGLMLPGCAEYVVGKVFLDQDRANIYVTENAAEVTDCKRLKEVQAKSYWGGLALQHEALEKCKAQLTQKARAAGANVLLLRQTKSGMMGSAATGEAYLCQEVKFTPPPGQP